MEQTIQIVSYVMVAIIGSALGATISAPVAFWLGRNFKIESVESTDKKIVIIS